MNAMIMAAGRGERMRPLTDDVPKPLLKAGGRALIEHALLHLKEAGFNEVVINHAHMGQKIIDFLGDGRRYGMTIQYSAEPDGALETGGGIRQAIALLDHKPFWSSTVISGRIFHCKSYQQVCRGWRTWCWWTTRVTIPMAIFILMVPMDTFHAANA